MRRVTWRQALAAARMPFWIYLWHGCVQEESFTELGLSLLLPSSGYCVALSSHGFLRRRGYAFACLLSSSYPWHSKRRASTICLKYTRPNLVLSKDRSHICNGLSLLDAIYVLFFVVLTLKVTNVRTDFMCGLSLYAGARSASACTSDPSPPNTVVQMGNFQY